jgi:hypothetical protein
MGNFIISKPLKHDELEASVVALRNQADAYNLPEAPTYEQARNDIMLGDTTFLLNGADPFNVPKIVNPSDLILDIMNQDPIA